jgi:hypothetical protein
MGEVLLGAARIFASHYQIVICDDPSRLLANEDHWTDEKTLHGFAGASSFRMVATAAHLNDHWIELYSLDQPPLFDEWQRVTCVPFHCSTGKVHVMSVVDREAPMTADIPKDSYAVYVAGQNLGIDQQSKGEEVCLSDEEIAGRKDLEWYRIFLVPGVPSRTGLRTALKDQRSIRRNGDGGLVGARANGKCPFAIRPLPFASPATSTPPCPPPLPLRTTPAADSRRLALPSRASRRRRRRRASGGS